MQLQKQEKLSMDRVGLWVDIGVKRATLQANDVSKRPKTGDGLAATSAMLPGHGAGHISWPDQSGIVHLVMMSTYKCGEYLEGEGTPWNHFPTFQAFFKQFKALKNYPT